ncbi:hypothetical protein AB0M46_33435 [Dactylosporangium sp. NPDC051485]|uniref:hypothetical protein n=1 Tax=Dactylosporangium sp. NPDC051485 TaxID=3154846 RepID=UPI0034120D07
MAGVAGPMLRERDQRFAAVRFLIALAIGGVAAALVLALLVYPAGRLLASVLPRDARLLVLAALTAVLGVADLRDRTPHMWRQVPQSLVRQLSPGPLGLVWGFDLGLLFSTQKVVSLLWAAIGAVLLLDPALAPWALGAFAITASAVVALWSFTPLSITVQAKWSPAWLRRIRWVSGSILLTAAVGASLTALT